MPPIPIAAPTNAISSVLANDARIFLLLLLEAADDGVVINPLPSKGPFTFNFADPAGLLTVTAGATDNSTPTMFELADTSGTKAGSVLITITDTANNLVATVQFTVNPVTPPPPPPGPTQLAAFVVPQ